MPRKRGKADGTTFEDEQPSTSSGAGLEKEPDYKRFRRERGGITINPIIPYTKPVLPPDAQVYGLTLYETHRQPRPPVIDESTTSIQVRTINIELTCPVCWGILQNTMTVMECLHRFCSGCISKSLRLGKKECPSCRVKCPSMRYLRPDPNFDGLIAKIYPNIDEYEAKQDSMIEEMNRKLMKSKTLMESVVEGKRRQALASKAKPKRDNSPFAEPDRQRKQTEMAIPKPKPKPQAPQKKVVKKPDARSTNASHPPGQSQAPGQGPEIGFVLVRHPAEKNVPQLSNKYLRTSRQLTVRHLCKFLAKKLNQEKFELFAISLYSNPSQDLEEDLTLEAIDRDLWKNNTDELALYYRLRSEPANLDTNLIPTV